MNGDGSQDLGRHGFERNMIVIIVRGGHGWVSGVFVCECVLWYVLLLVDVDVDVVLCHGAILNYRHLFNYFRRFPRQEQVKAGGFDVKQQTTGMKGRTLERQDVYIPERLSNRVSSDQ